LKVAYIHTGQWLSNSPSSTFATYNVIGMSSVFEECHFFIKRDFKTEPEDLFENYFGLKKPANLLMHSYNNKFWLTSNIMYYKFVYRSLKKLIKENRIEAVISRNVSFLPYLAKIKLKYNIPTLLESHDFFANLNIRDDVNIKKKKKYQKMEKKYIPQISGVICLQKAQKDQYLKEFPEQNVFVCRTGIHKIHKNKKENNKSRKYIGYIGSLNAHKGVENILKAAAVSKVKPDVLIIGGKSNNEIDKFRLLVEKTYDKDKVKITGWLNKVEMKKYINQIKIGVIPLHDTFFNRHLTSPLKLFDFYSYGIPVISSDLPTMRELVDENKTGLFFKSDDIESLAGQIDFLFKNDEVYNEMSNNVLEKAGHFLWETRAEKIELILKDLTK
jgi:glycosyltransferase involved in cell wall biosynthesis